MPNKKLLFTCTFCVHGGDLERGANRGIYAVICAGAGMATDFPELVIRSFSDLADVFLAVKNHLGSSNETLGEIAGAGYPGFVDKYLGRSRSKRLSETSFNLLIGALGIRLRVEIDPDQAQRVAGRWERRNELQIRTCQPLSAKVLDQARAIVLSEMARKGWQTRQAKRSGQAAA